MNYFYLAIGIVVVTGILAVIYLARTWKKRTNYKILYAPDSWSPPLSVVPGDHHCMGNFIHSPCCHACPIIGVCQEHSPVRKFIEEVKNDHLKDDCDRCCALICADLYHVGNDFKPRRRSDEHQP